jgi:hypothetical protein
MGFHSSRVWKPKMPVPADPCSGEGPLLRMAPLAVLGVCVAGEGASYMAVSPSYLVIQTLGGLDFKIWICGDASLQITACGLMQHVLKSVCL